MRPTPEASGVASALIVGPDRGDRALLGDALRVLGIVVNEAADFHRAKEVLVSTPPDALITELRLGAYNGLHLVLRCKTERPQVKAIVLARAPDPVLQQEAAELDAAFVVREGDGAWIGSIVAALGSLAPNRQVLALPPAEGA